MILIPASALQDQNQQKPGAPEPLIPGRVAVALAVTQFWLAATHLYDIDDECYSRPLPPSADLAVNQAFDVLADYMAGKPLIAAKLGSGDKA